MHIYIFCVPVWNQHCVSVGEELKVHVSEMFAKNKKKNQHLPEFFFHFKQVNMCQQAVEVTISALNGANVHFNQN